jgi:L-2-hydroxyglutarate oxidase LhgO
MEKNSCLALCWFFNPILKKWILFRLAFIHKTRQYFSDVVSRNKNIPLTKYLIQQVRQSPKDRIDALKEYVPSAKSKDWIIERAGQRVKLSKDKKKAGYLNLALR